MSNQKTIKQLIEKITSPFEVISGSTGTSVTSIEYNSMTASPGTLFVAIKGYSVDGHTYIDNAVEKGAVCIVITDDRKGDFGYLRDRDICIISVPDTREALSCIAAAYYGFPARDMVMIGITGTNGKTSITYMLESVYKEAGFVCGVIGTINYRWKDTVREAHNTTPESKDLQEILFAMKKDGVQVVIMEVSSHSLFLKRVNDVYFNFAVFTNLTRDHLDFHEDFEQYFYAKKQLFDLLDNSPKQNKAGLINVDDEYGKRIYKEKSNYKCPLYGYGFDDNADFRVVEKTVKNALDGLSYSLTSPEKEIRIDMQLSGFFQIYNSLSALSVAYQGGIAWDIIIQGLRNVQSIPGRLEVIRTGEGFGVVVDYAHTDDALKNVLQSVRDLVGSSLITVFGCGGDRDRTKRPLMGQVAEQYSDRVIVTSDNPRTEDPQAIINDIVSGLQKENHSVIIDREMAIKQAIGSAGIGDIIVIAGKGHEDYQIIGKNKIHFDDKEVALKYIAQRSAEQ